MNSPMQYVTSPMLIVMTVFFGLIIFVTVLKSLKKWGFFEDWTTPLVALCVTVLCLMGMYQLVDSPRQPADRPQDDTGHGRHEGFYLFLFPYALLGILILLILPILKSRSLFSADESQRLNHGGRRRDTQTERREMDQRRWRK